MLRVLFDFVADTWPGWVLACRIFHVLELGNSKAGPRAKVRIRAVR
jgi:hypothetical protein